MSDTARELEPLFARYVEEHVLHGRVLAAAELCGPRLDLIAPLDRLIERYQSITALLDPGLDDGPGTTADPLPRSPSPDQPWPQFAGFKTMREEVFWGVGANFEVPLRESIALGLAIEYNQNVSNVDRDDYENWKFVIGPQGRF
jgi:hypothetical protein